MNTNKNARIAIIGAGAGGISAAYFVKFMSPKNWASLILSGVKITNKWPKVFVEGMQNFWEKVATNSTVKTNTKVVKIQRNSQNQQAPIQVWIENQQQALHFDKLIIACPLNPKTIQFLDIDAHEKALFEQIQTIPFTSTACTVKGLPAGVVATIPFDKDKIIDGEYTGYIKDYQSDEMAIFFSILPKGKDGAYVVEKIKNVLQDIPPYNGQEPELLEVHLQRIWEYFPHVSPEAQKNGFYKQIEALQGQKNTYFVGSLFSFEIVGNTAAYSKALVEKNF